ncbi:MAG: two-component system sensor histidine kinase NtrB [Spirochaetota bacterium]
MEKRKQAAAFGTNDKQKILEKLEESERKYRLLAENVTDVIFVQDLNYNVTYISPSVKNILGYSECEVIGRNAKDFLTPSSYKKALENYNTYVPRAVKDKGFDIPLMEYQYVKKDGSTMWGEMKVKVLTDENRRLLGTQGVIRDITQRKNLEEKLIQAQKLEAVGRMAGGIAHEFNNILTVILGYSEILLQKQGLQNTIRGMISEIQRCGQRASGLVQNLLSFSRHQELKPSIININDLIGELSKVLQRVIGVHITLETGLDSRPLPIRIDPHQFEQVILNMALNARDAMQEGGKMTIGTTLLHLPQDVSFIPGADRQLYPGMEKGKYVCISVSDTGTGMSSKVKQQIFDPFFTTKSISKGTGLGLSIVHGIVKQSEGYIYVSTNPNKGTTFSLLFPLVED